MKIHKLTPSDPDFPNLLKHIPDPPQQLYVLGNRALLNDPNTLAIVGSRALTPYGKTVTDQLAKSAASKGIVIISGMALGVDGIAHRAALTAKSGTIAVLANGLDRMYPATHRSLAQQILVQGGTIVSEYPEGTEPHRHHFIARNRLVSGLAKAILITEAAAKSGTLHTARFALEQGRDVMAVPGNITNALSKGTNNLIKAGAIPVTEPQDIANYFGLSSDNKQASLMGANQEEQTLLDLLGQGIADATELLQHSQLDAAVFNQTLTMLEITGSIRPLGANRWTLI